MYNYRVVVEENAVRLKIDSEKPRREKGNLFIYEKIKTESKNYYMNGRQIKTSDRSITMERVNKIYFNVLLFYFTFCVLKEDQKRKQYKSGSEIREVTVI